MPKTVCLALTGASGMVYGFRLLGSLLESGCHVRLVYSKVAIVVAREEMGIELPSHEKLTSGDTEFFEQLDRKSVV